jgi:LPS-assembly protein
MSRACLLQVAAVRAALCLLVALPAVAIAQDSLTVRAHDQALDRASNQLELPQQIEPAEPIVSAEPSAPPSSSGPREIEFEANIVSYDEPSDTITASGDVVIRSGDRSLRSNTVIWNRKTGAINAVGRVRFVDDNGNQLFSNGLELNDKFEAGAMQDLLLALRQGGRLAAKSGSRGDDGTIELTQAAYSACAVIGADDCARDPSWRVTADRVTYDPENRKVRFKGAVLEIFGARVLPLPGLSVRTDGGAVSGFLVPDLRISESNGVEVSGSYYHRFDNSRDLTTTVSVFTEAPPLVNAQYRQLTKNGAFQVTAYGTHSQRISDFTGIPTSESDPRGYLFANGTFHFNQNWTLTTSIRLASDRTFLRRYDISRDDRLRSTIDLERIDDSSYLSIAGWATQTLRLGADQGQVPIALPAIDYRKRIADPLFGGKIELQANSLAILRDVGQDTQRAFAGAKWDLKRVTPLGQVLTLTALARGDIFHSDENALTETAIYRGDAGWQGRAIGLAALDIEWPFVGNILGGEQTLVPRVQVVLAPRFRNLAVPNEDSRAIDLEDSNLFALNRFPGHDRVEDGIRVTYGVDWQLRRPDWEVSANIGQSFRAEKDELLFPDGTGLSDRVSDFVGRNQLRYKNIVKFTHRYRLDKDNLGVRRNEIDATLGDNRTYVELGYLRLNRDITLVEDLQDREELRAAARVAFANHWSVFGSGVFNLTDFDEDPSFTSDGFEPIRTRFGVAYQDDCLEMGLTWRRDFITSGDAQRGNTFQLFFAIRNLGFR